MKSNMRKTLLVVLSIFILSATLFAVACGPKTGSAKFIAMDGSEITSVSGEVGSEITAPDAPIIYGYNFVGWFTQKEGGNKVSFPQRITEGETTFYAQYKKLDTGKLNLDAGEGTIETTTYDVVVGENVYEFLKDKTPVLKGGVFAGWYYQGNVIKEDFVMPKSAITLRAKYKIEYSVEVYKQDMNGEYRLSEEDTKRGLTDWAGKTFDPIFDMEEPENFIFNEEKSLAITLEAGKENICRVYFDRFTYNVRYFSGAPVDTESEGSVEEVKGIFAGQTIEVSANGYSIKGYRFAGWSDSLNGEIKFQPGEKLTVNANTNLYACWNYGMKDSYGGNDIIFALKENKSEVVLVRENIEEKKGTFNSETGEFVFNVDDGTLLKGRINNDGKTFVYFKEEFSKTYNIMDAQTSSIPEKGATLKLDGFNRASYQNGEKVVEGEFLPKESGFTFKSDEIEFFFKIGTREEGGIKTNIFVIRDEYAGQYNFMNVLGNIYKYPVLVMDGFGLGVYAQSKTENFPCIYKTLDNGSLEVTYKTTEATENTIIECKVKQVETQAQTVMSVFTVADKLKGSYTFPMKGSNDTMGEMTLNLDGFGGGKYDFKGSEAGNNANGDIAYLSKMQFKDSKADWYVISFVVGNTVYTLKIDSASKEAPALIGNEAGLYPEFSAKSGQQARMQMFGDGSAVIETVNKEGVFTSAVEGKYVFDEVKQEYTFTADKYNGDEGQLSPYYGNFNFRLAKGQRGLMFVVFENFVDSYTFKFGDNGNFELKCNGYGMGTLTNLDNSQKSEIPYSHMDGYGDYQFIAINLGKYGMLYLRVQAGVKEAETYFNTPFGGFMDLNNRIEEYNDEIMFLYPDGHGVIKSTKNGEYVDVAEGSYVADSAVNGRFTFTANSFPQGEADYLCYSKFQFTYGKAMNYPVFLVFNEKEVLAFEDVLTLDGYGLAKYKEQQFVYKINSDTITLLSLGGSKGYTLKYDAVNGKITEPDEIQGDYFSYILNKAENKFEIGNYLLMLDGFGNASLKVIEGTGKDAKYVDFASGTYTKNAGDYSVKFTVGAAENFSFRTKMQKLDGVNYPVYVMSDKTVEKVYEIDGGGSIVIDGYGATTYVDEKGVSSFVIIQESEDNAISGRKIMLVIVFGEGGMGIKAVDSYVIGENNGKFTLTKLDGQNGKYESVVNGEIKKDNTLILDGFGNAKIVNYNENGDEVVVMEGKCSKDEKSGKWVFTSTDGTKIFAFNMTRVKSSDDKLHYVYFIYNEKMDVKVTSSSWSSLVLDGFVVATYIDENGHKYALNYSVVDENTVCVYGFKSGKKMYFSINRADNTFTEIADPTVKQ